MIALGEKKKILSYSLYGFANKYLQGAIRNAEQVLEFYPGWIPRFYVGRSISGRVVEELMAFGSEVIRMDGPEDASAMFWRYKAFFDPSVSIVMIRDADSRIGNREASAVKDWLESGHGFHIMRDHPAHFCAILGGLWGAHTDRMINLKPLFEKIRPEGLYGEDQNFLEECVYPIAMKDSLIHDSFFSFERSAQPFPCARDGLEFVGEVYDENEKPRLQDREVLASVEASICRRFKIKVVSAMRKFT